MSASTGWAAAQVGYCSNVHPTHDLARLKASIEQHFQGVRAQRGLKQQDSGLWISALAATGLQQKTARAEFLGLLQRSGLRLTSLNGFPYGQFHEGAVKAAVYLPSWAEPKRLAYSLELAQILAQALPADCHQGVISTVPLGYAATWSPTLQQRAEFQLRELTTSLARLHRETGKKIVFCLEMEPDCVLENTDQTIAFFRRWQITDPHHEYLALCFDVCHQAVMFEDCYRSLVRLRQARVPIGKIQLSNALVCRLPTADDSRRERVLKTLRDFCETTYLHQVKALDAQDRLVAWADLPAALDDCAKHPDRHAELRIHFHIPLFSEQLVLPELSGSQIALAQTFDYLADHREFRPVLEVETYSWGVLPAQLRPTTEHAQLQGIAAELQWVEEQLRQRQLLQPQAQETYADAL
ncbi:sugar phosphate isomerase/epimerase [Pseudomonas sp. 91RF]|jgi:sugar phosphate isomerase/epimerase|uniref:metabolite traffic protein EboE n=1 Tax=Pseudomonas sp. 91RF TaxID=2292261 RepID=UPI000E6666E5|nr:metabolite traffic protein EboE [Pseudomonas sp. 91RF]RIJ09723.1 sugar phosphate isomerase/epimerase [Pseudomonas sp. 91RF]